MQRGRDQTPPGRTSPGTLPYLTFARARPEPMPRRGRLHRGGPRCYGGTDRGTDQACDRRRLSQPRIVDPVIPGAGSIRATLRAATRPGPPRPLHEKRGDRDHAESSPDRDGDHREDREADRDGVRSDATRETNRITAAMMRSKATPIRMKSQARSSSPDRGDRSSFNGGCRARHHRSPRRRPSSLSQRLVEHPRQPRPGLVEPTLR